ncbi:xanthine dehydrogenase accessory protein XdhC [Pseudosulfitobacter koreensis]|uniref:Xanthine dehydrogenase accessory protein XdhC n=1 Tax=Pseudosulfitobacter koreensis TaxID=2968472 RepID=A0ABT1Z400_9RHOB|nr:xanthine dehydrogenase accessory protein XdhC [Pseudosulfitobacter koreense]MCR8827845.1 xanthine dehydrogenase accessory protein XdhC [Pseudosulfitobacter koreense]
MMDLNALGAAIKAHGRVVRIVLADVRGSAPRAAGTSMLVWSGGLSGTIGGGRLELEAVSHAKAMLKQDAPPPRTLKLALGPTLNQCCGGAVVLVLEWFDAVRFEAIKTDFDGVWARRVSEADDMPAPMKRACARAASHGAPLRSMYQGGWLAEALWQERQQVVIHGAGHVGRALAGVLDALPQYDVLVSDTRQGELTQLPEHIARTDAQPADVLAAAQRSAAHYIMTPEHDLDLELCHHLLNREFAFAGLIGSATKWARFRSRLAALGHAPARIDRITCPIGDPALGKHPQAIAVGAAAQLLMMRKPLPALTKETA